MPNLSIKVRFSGPWIAENKKAKTRKNQGFMRVFCMAGAVGRGFIYESALLDDRKHTLSVPVCAPPAYKTVTRTVLLYGVSPLGVQVPPSRTKKLKERKNPLL